MPAATLTRNSPMSVLLPIPEFLRKGIFSNNQLNANRYMVNSR